MRVVVPMRFLCGLFGMTTILAVTLPAQGRTAPQSRLVHCGSETCLQLSGWRPRADIAIRVGGQDLAVTGGRTWAIAVPLAIARTWQANFADGLAVTYHDPRDGSVRTEATALPPGALGRRVELASLTVTSH